MREEEEIERESERKDRGNERKGKQMGTGKRGVMIPREGEMTGLE